MSKKNYKKTAVEILDSVGGKDNVQNVVHCATRLRFHLKNNDKANKTETEKINEVLQVVESGGQYQVVIGNIVGDVYEQLIPMLDKNVNSNSDVKSGSFFNKAIDLISGIFVPILPALIGAGMIKGMLMLAVQLGLNSKNGTYQIWYAASDAVFYFLPVLLAVTSAKKFKANTFLALAVAGAMEYPTLVTLFGNAATKLTFLGIPVVGAKYPSSVLPIIFTIYFMSKIEHFCNDHFHPAVKNVLTPLISIGVTVPIAFLIIGPVMDILGNWLGKGYSSLYNLSPLICGAIFGAIWQILVVFGLHWGIVPIGYNNLALYGRNTINGMVGPSNFAQAGAAFGVFLKSKNTEIKELALSSSVTGIFSITEPSIYGINLKYKKPFYIACGVSAIAGAITGSANSAAVAAGPVGILSIPIFVGKGFVPFLIAIIFAFFATAALTYFFGYKDEEHKPKQVNKSNIPVGEKITSPLEGESFSLEKVNDTAFSSLALGEGVAITPKEGKIYSPVSGIVRVAYNTGHAYGLLSNNGAEILIHLGINTVELKGKYFTSHVTQGMKVSKGDLIAEYDLDKIKRAGYDPTVMEIVTNTSEYTSVLTTEFGRVNRDSVVIELEGK